MDEEIIKIIEERKIKPAPRSYFLAKNFFYWLVSALSLAIAGLSFGLIIFLLTNSDWYLYKYLNTSQAQYALLAMPYLWFFVLAVFSIFAYSYFRSTKKGYRYDYIVVFSGGASAVLILGVIFLGLGACENVHIALKRISTYESLVYDKDDAWSNPEKGLLAGKVIRVDDNANFAILDSNGKIWNIKTDLAKLPGGVNLKNGQTVRLIGIASAGNIFLANMSKP